MRKKINISKDDIGIWGYFSLRMFSNFRNSSPGTASSEVLKMYPAFNVSSRRNPRIKCEQEIGVSHITCRSLQITLIPGTKLMRFWINSDTSCLVLGSLNSHFAQNYF